MNSSTRRRVHKVLSVLLYIVMIIFICSFAGSALTYFVWSFEDGIGTATVPFALIYAAWKIFVSVIIGTLASYLRKCSKESFSGKYSGKYIVLSLVMGLLHTLYIFVTTVMITYALIGVYIGIGSQTGLFLDSSLDEGLIAYPGSMLIKPTMTGFAALFILAVVFCVITSLLRYKLDKMRRDGTFAAKPMTHGIQTVMSQEDTERKKQELRKRLEERGVNTSSRLTIADIVEKRNFSNGDKYVSDNNNPFNG